MDLIPFLVLGAVAAAGVVVATAVQRVQQARERERLMRVDGCPVCGSDAGRRDAGAWVCDHCRFDGRRATEETERLLQDLGQLHTAVFATDRFIRQNGWRAALPGGVDPLDTYQECCDEVSELASRFASADFTLPLHEKDWRGAVHLLDDLEAVAAQLRGQVMRSLRKE